MSEHKCPYCGSKFETSEILGKHLDSRVCDPKN